MISRLEDFFRDNNSILLGGYVEAAKHWQSVTSEPVGSPPGLSAFDLPASLKFFEIWKETFNHNDHEDAVECDWEATGTIKKVRSVFEQWGLWIVSKKSTSDKRRCLGAGARLFARLPLWTIKRREDVGSSGSFFYPRATLPCVGLVGQWAKTADTLFAGGRGGTEVVSLPFPQTNFRLRRDVARVLVRSRKSHLDGEQGLYRGVPVQLVWVWPWDASLHDAFLSIGEIWWR